MNQTLAKAGTRRQRAASAWTGRRRTAEQRQDCKAARPGCPELCSANGRQPARPDHYATRPYKLWTTPSYLLTKYEQPLTSSSRYRAESCGVSGVAAGRGSRIFLLSPAERAPRDAGSIRLNAPLAVRERVQRHEGQQRGSVQELRFFGRQLGFVFKDAKDLRR